MNYIESGNIVGGDNPDQQHNTGYIGIEMQFPCFYIDVAWQNVIQNNILDKVVTVIFFVIILLDAGE